MLKAGDLDEQVTFRERSATTDPELGTKSYTWSDFATVWADVYHMLGTEKIADGLDMTRHPCRVIIRHRSDITPQMRVVIDGEEYQITRGPTEMGRREGLKMVCERYSTEGDEA